MIYGNAYKGNRLVWIGSSPGPGTIQKSRILCDVGYDDGLAICYHSAGYAFSELVVSPSPGLGGQSVGNLYLQL